MGGKTKQAQRTKNNSRPSNSGRSAELLGTTIPSFVGFTVHTDLGLVPLAPGFSTAESLPDTFDSSVSSQCQLVLRKMSKKDPITKVKALQEFSELVSESDVDFVKTILPLWPKFYHNLANDVEHRVRESAQQAQNAVVTKAGKLIAPYLKQLAPVWISSQFDNYAPVASLASSTFNASFSPKKVQEVFTFCQNEILDYIIKNLTFHTATTLSNTKSCTPEEAENKYQRVIVCSLKSLALYLEKTSGKQTSEIEEKLKNLLQNQKFWSFSKHKATNIRAAWFEILFAFLQHAPNVVEANKNQIIQVTFQNMDDSDPLTLPHVWGCILLIQTIFNDWHVSINFKKAILPKLSLLLKNAAKTNFDVVHPSLLPFISKFSDETIPNYSLQEFYTDFFNNIKLSITSLDNTASKAVIGSITATFYECIRYVVQQKNVTIEKSTESPPDTSFCMTILNDYIIDVIKWSLTNETIATKYIFIHISTLIAYWSQNSETSKLYADILEQFWSQIRQLISEDIDYTEEYLKHLVDFIQNLYNASPYHHDNKVKFSDEQDEAAKNTKSKNVVYLLHKRLKEIAIYLARLLIEKSSKEKTVNYITQLKCLTDMFGDAAFYSDITKDNNLQSTVEIFSTFLNEQQPPESAIDIIFEVMMLMDKVERYQHVEKLLKIPNNIVHQWILQRLLSYPLCIEPEIREILSQKHVSEMILKITKEVIEENSKEKFNLLHKCFFQMESGEILINSETVDGIIRIMSEPLITEGMEEMLDTCGSFIAQIMPVICSDNSTKELQHDVFLKLFKFSVNMVENDNLSEDTLWEITTCWQDALSSNDIVMDEMLLINCAKIIEQKISQDDDLAIQEINNIADVTAKLILCSTENLSSEDERNNQIDKIIDQLLDTTSEKYRNSYDYVKNLCLYFESIRGVMTASALRENFDEELPVNDFRNFFRKQLLNVSTVLKLVCNIRTEKQSDIGENKPLSEDDQEYTEDYFDPNEHLLKVWSEKIYSHILQSINIAAIGESLLINSTMINDDDEYVILNLTEKCSLILKHSAESFILTIKDRIFETASTTEISWIRTIPFLLNTTQYSDTENGPIILYEDACSYMLENNSFISYINITHIMMPKLGNKNLPINYDVLANSVDLTIRETALRCLISNHFTEDYNQISDKKIINQCCSLIDEIANKHKEVDNTLLLCDRDIQPVELSKVIFVTEYINLLAEAVEKFSTQLTLKNWDSIRIGLSWWTLSVSKSLENYKNLKVSIFISRVFKLYDALTKFIIDGKTKSSTHMLTNVIDEWENLFAKEVNIVLFKSYYNLVSFVGSTDHVNSGSALLDEIGTYVENLEYSDIFEASKSGFKITTNDIVNFILHNLSNNIYSVRIACLYMLQQLTKLLVSIDFSNLDKHTETVEGNTNAEDQNDEWHLLNKFSPFLLKYENQIHEYIEEFSYKLTELPNLKKINREAALSYLLIWDSIIYICAQAPAELRSIYATWIRDNKYEQTLLNFLFRAMPIEILKNHDSKIMNNDMFRTINWLQHKDPELSTERYACYLYSQMLRHLPAVVRKWWNATNARQKTFVDKLTTNFVSSLICQEELRAIVDKKEKHENMQVTVHTSTREVVAVYSIDEARMELVITLAPNHPLGAVKVESRKQIGGRAQSRNVGMQLTIFLTHQNGSIFDGLYLWKRNLDKKFEGVEECYVCYTVIHQDTCQLPKLTCQTCKKKFHGPCLYKWFTTSSKSTCPICRNVF